MGEHAKTGMHAVARRIDRTLPCRTTRKKTPTSRGSGLQLTHADKKLTFWDDPPLETQSCSPTHANTFPNIPSESPSVHRRAHATRHANQRGFDLGRC